MSDCDRVRDLLPWYVTGKLGSTDTAAVAAHIQSCESCRLELSEVVWVSNTVRSDRGDLPAVREKVWRHVTVRAGFRDMARVDVGSLLVGFRLGVNARRLRAPVRASVRVMGRNVRIVGGSARKSEKPEEGSTR